MAVPNSITGITGDGTQSNPYLVSTIDEILQCIAVSDAYVELTDDIYCRDYPAYRDIVNVSFNILCKKFYAQTQKTIYGLQTYGTDPNSSTGTFMTASANSEIENICFIDTVLYRQTTDGGDSWDFNFRDTSKMTNCVFSILQLPKYNARSCGVIWGGILDHCSIKFEYASTYSFTYDGSYGHVYNAFRPASADKCYIYIGNMPINWVVDYSFFKRVTNSSIYVNNMRITDIYNLSDSGTEYIYTLDSTDNNNLFYLNISYLKVQPYAYASKVVRISIGGGSKNLVSASLGSDVDSRAKLYWTGSAVQTSLNNIRSYDYLVDQGFITNVTELDNGWDSDEYYYRDAFLMPVPIGLDASDVGTSTIYKNMPYHSERTFGFYSGVSDGQPNGSFAYSGLKNIRLRKEITEIGRFSFTDSSLQTATLAPDCKYYENTFPSSTTMSFYPAEIIISPDSFELELGDTELPSGTTYSIRVTDGSGSVTRALTGYEYQMYTDFPVTDALGSVVYYFNNRNNSIREYFTYTIEGANLFSGSFSQGRIDYAGESQQDLKTVTSTGCTVRTGDYFCSTLPRSSKIQIYKYTPSGTVIESNNNVDPSKIHMETLDDSVTGQIPIWIGDESTPVTDYTIYGNQSLSVSDQSPTTPATLSVAFWSVTNIFPYAQYSTQTSSGVTFISDGSGGYHIKGKSTSSVTFAVDLVSSVTFPYSINNGGTGALYFGNTASANGVTVNFYNGSTRQDYWNSQYITNIPHATQGYGSLQNKTVNRLTFALDSGKEYDISFYIMLTSDGVGINAGRKFSVYGSANTTSLLVNRVQMYFPCGNSSLFGISDWNVYDTLDYGNSTATSRLGKLDLSSASSLNFVADQDYFYCALSEISNMKQSSRLLCTHLQPVSSLSDMGYGKCFCDQNYLYVGLKTTGVETVADLDTWLQQQVSSSTPVSLLYELQTHTTSSVSLPALQNVASQFITTLKGDFEQTPIRFSTDGVYKLKFSVRDTSGSNITPSDIDDFGYYDISQ